MLNNIFFSIVIPTYNRASFIHKTIDSVLNQNYQDFEIIVVDDGSTDNTEDLIRSISSEKINYFKIENSERGRARNFGMENSRGDYVTFLDSDDLLFSNYFANANESIHHYNTPPFLHLAYEVVNPNDNVLLKINYLQSNDINFLVKGNSLSCTGCFLRNDIAKTLRFNEDRDLSGSEDWELWFRVLANYGIKTDNRISAKIINHNERSVLLSHGNEAKLVLRKELALKYAFKDTAVQEKYGKHFKKIDAFGDSYISLHLALKASIFLKCFPYFS
jgi:glycosyltransferase involved in cell wall biosynthesis